ncbi:hypothetical protein [Primorskyibacter sp. 2E233]|uniref:hypothetical protein n=1 Tax=Primorskyibacter sp. 2E233 TaxID=3413431 RepID=UPI003BF34EFF
MPAYCCADMAQGAGPNVRFYGSDAQLCPDTESLSAKVQPGDLVLGVNHFGRPAEALRRVAQSRPDVTWVEDCAQCVDTAAPAWAPLRIFSPRKVMCAADGGVLIDHDGRLPVPAQSPAASARLRHAGLLRSRDPLDQNNALWYAAFQRAEAAMDVSNHEMSARSQRLLQATPLSALSDARRRNYSHLHQSLGAIALWSDPAPDWTPLGFPIRVKDAAALGAALARHRIFAPRHWAKLATGTPPAIEAQLSRQLLTLSCDQRYDLRDMDRLIAAVQDCAL